MAVYEINLQPVAQQSQLVELSGREYRLTFTWRRRTEHVYLDIETPDGDPLVRGRRVRAWADALTGVLDIPGSVFATGPDYLSYTDIGDTFRVWYVTDD